MSGKPLKVLSYRLMNQFLTVLTIVTGCLTVVSFVLQVAGLFPRYRKYITPALFLFMGLTLGLIANVASNSTVVLPITLTAREFSGLLLYIASGGMVAFAIFVSIFTDIPARRTSAENSAIAAGLFFVLALVFGVSFFFGDSNVFGNEKRDTLTVEELNVLAEHSRDVRDYDRAIDLFHAAIDQQEAQLRERGESTLIISPGGKLLQHYRDQIQLIQRERIPDSR